MNHIGVNIGQRDYNTRRIHIIGRFPQPTKYNNIMYVPSFLLCPFTVQIIGYPITKHLFKHGILRNTFTKYPLISLSFVLNARRFSSNPVRRNFDDSIYF